jgi:hypothetical protein
MKYEPKVWNNLLTSRTFSGETKIECINIFLEKNPIKHQNVLIKQFLLILNRAKYNNNNPESDRLKTYCLNKHIEITGNKYLPTDYSKLITFELLKVETKWDVEYFYPYINLFKELGIKFPFKNRIEFKKNVLAKNTIEFNAIDYFENFEVVIDFLQSRSKDISNNKKTEIKNISILKMPKQNNTFSFYGDIKKLEHVIDELCFEVELINEEHNNQKDVLNILLAKDLKKITTEIRLNCETITFRYIINKLQPYFHNLKLIVIEKSALFYSKNGKLITAQNLYSSKIHNPKQKDKIDMIIKHLQ